MISRAMMLQQPTLEIWRTINVSPQIHKLQPPGPLLIRGRTRVSVFIFTIVELGTANIFSNDNGASWPKWLLFVKGY